MNKAALESVRQIIDNGLISFGYISFNLVDFQRPDRVCGSVGPAFKFTRLIQISHIDKRSKFFFRSIQKAWNILFNVFEVTAFSLIAAGGFFPIRLVTSLFSTLTTLGSLATLTTVGADL